MLCACLSQNKWHAAGSSMSDARREVMCGMRCLGAERAQKSSESQSRADRPRRGRRLQSLVCPVSRLDPDQPGNTASEAGPKAHQPMLTLHYDCSPQAQRAAPLCTSSTCVYPNTGAPKLVTRTARIVAAMLLAHGVHDIPTYNCEFNADRPTRLNSSRGRHQVRRGGRGWGCRNESGLGDVRGSSYVANCCLLSEALLKC